MDKDTKFMIYGIIVLMVIGIYYSWQYIKDDNPLQFVKKEMTDRYQKEKHGCNNN